MVALPSVIGVYVFDAGAWKRANGGTPIAYSGPQVYNAGAWKNCVQVYGYTTAWQTAWVNAQRELSVGGRSAADFGISPYTVSAYIWFQSDGSVDRNHNGTTTQNYANWRAYDCGRSFEIQASRSSSGTYVTGEPTPLDTWMTMNTANGQFSASDSGTGFLNWDTTWTVWMRDDVRLYALGDKSGSVYLLLEAEV